MLTIFTIPKPFVGHIDTIQRNALQSWLFLQPNCEVILCGNDAGVAQVAAEFAVIHLPNINQNEFGTPLLSSAFEAAQNVARHDLICYVNADIIFLPELITSISRINFANYLLVGQRWDIEIDQLIDFKSEKWADDLKRKVNEAGQLHAPTGSDYFIFPNRSLGALPDFAVGRPGWDNWFIYDARALKRPVVDLTPVNMVIHQNHDYAHIQRTGPGTKWQGPEEKINWDLMGGQKFNYTLWDATHVMTELRVQPALAPKYVRRRLLRYWQHIRHRRVS